MNSNFRRGTPELIRLLVDHVPSMLAYWDRELLCRFANRAYERWFGVDPDTLIGTSLKDLLGPKLFALNKPYIQAALDGHDQTFERVVPGPGGVQRHSLAHYIPDVDDGRVVGFIAHVTEVTQLKQTEAALRAEVAHRERALQQLRESKAALVEAQRLGGVGNWEWEIASDITIWSDELYRIFGRDPRRLPPTFAEHPSLYSAQSWLRLQAAVAQALRTGEPYTLELEYVGANGQTGWLECRGEAVHDETGRITRLRGTACEITVRRRAEEDRVKALAADAASRNKSQLLSHISHELRTPLNAILGFSYLCQRDETLDPKHRQWAATIGSAGRHMLELIEDMLDLSAAEAGRIEIRHAAFDLTGLMRDCLRQASTAAEASRIVLQEVDPQVEPIRVHSDAKRLKQVMDNLLSNAIKYNRPGGEVSVCLSDLGDTVLVKVQDTGLGMSPEQLERLFQPFERLGAEKGGIPGTGLGLSLSKTFVELLGGRIRAESTPGTGSTFTVELPKEVGDGPTAAAPV